jgi:magnesium chelatase family protein
LPIALAPRAPSDKTAFWNLAHYFLAGELSLSGELRPMKGRLAIALEAKRYGG